MRIRKNAKLSSLLRSLAAASPPDAPLPSSHVCQLNQSPWDVLPFSSLPDALAPSGSSSPLPHQLDGGEDSFTANGSFGDSFGAVESSVASMMAVDAEAKTVIVNKLEGHAFYDINNEDRMNINDCGAHKGGDFDGDFSFKVCCNKTDGKRWQCKNEAADGHYLCEHHLSQLKTYATTAADDDDDDDDNADDSASRKLDKSSASTGRRGGRPRGAKKNSSSSSAAAAAAANSSQFYYYSGFGPSWGKRRSGRAGDQQPRRPEGRAAGGGPRPAPQRIGGGGGGGGIDYVDYDMDDDDEEEEEDEDIGDSGKKRTRKPVKARSLKSLM